MLECFTSETNEPISFECNIHKLMRLRVTTDSHPASRGELLKNFCYFPSVVSVRVPGYRTRGPVSIPGSTIFFSEK
jgi:hypothetical protein